jgi:hypothetical protein
MWMVSWSAMPCCWACSSSRSKKYFTARGTGRLVLRITWNRSSTNFCRVPCRKRGNQKIQSARGLQHQHSLRYLMAHLPVQAPHHPQIRVAILPHSPDSTAHPAPAQALAGFPFPTFMDSRRVR